MTALPYYQLLVRDFSLEGELSPRRNLGHSIMSTSSPTMLREQNPRLQRELPTKRETEAALCWHQHREQLLV